MNKYELYYQVAYSQLLEQDDRNRHIDLRATGILGFSGTLLGLALLTIDDWTRYSLFVAPFMFLAFLSCAVLCIGVVKVRNWKRNPELPVMYYHLATHEDIDMAAWAGNEISRAYDINEKIIRDKGEDLNTAIKWFAIEATLLGGLAASTLL